MCDLAPRQHYDIHAAIREANIKTAGLYGWPRIRASAALTPLAPSTPAQSFPDDRFPRAGDAGGAEGEG